MEDNVRDVLVAVASGLFGFLTGVSVAKLGFDHSAKVQLAAWRREDEQRQGDRSEAQLDRFRDRRRELYATLITGSILVWSKSADMDTRVRAYSAAEEISLLRPDLADLAVAVRTAAFSATPIDAGLLSAIKKFKAAAAADVGK